MESVRQPAVAGKFYPSNRRQLQQAVYQYLQVRPPTPYSPKAIIAPHAGYPYSGPIAGVAYACLPPSLTTRVRRVILLGPAHFVPLRGLAASSATAFATPLGRVPLDRAAQEGILQLPQVQVFDKAHAPEHSLEVHLPFLQTILADFSLVPLLVGEATPAEVAGVLDLLWGGPETVIIISSDLSHYYDYETARRLDASTAGAIQSFQPLAEGQACGRIAINGLLQVARQKGLSCQVVDLRNSGDTAGPRDQVVGYGAFVFGEP